MFDPWITHYFSHFEIEHGVTVTVPYLSGLLVKLRGKQGRIWVCLAMIGLICLFT